MQLIYWISGTTPIWMTTEQAERVLAECDRSTGESRDMHDLVRGIYGQDGKHCDMPHGFVTVEDRATDDEIRAAIRADDVESAGGYPCECCGDTTSSAVRLVREQDRGSCAALGWSAMACRAYLVPVSLCKACDDAEAIPDGYFVLSEAARSAKGGAS